MKQRIEIGKNVLAELLNFSVVLSVLTLVFANFTEPFNGIGRLLLLGIVPVLYYLIRELCGSIFLFFLLHILPLLGIFLLWSQGTLEKVVFGISAGLYLFYSVGKRLTSKKRSAEALIPPVAGGLQFLFYFCDALQGKGEAGGYLIQITIFYLVGYFVYYYLKQFLIYIDINSRSTENVPTGYIFSSSFSLVMGFTFGTGLVMFLGANRQLLDRFSAWLGEKIRMAVYWIISLFLREDGRETPPGKADFWTISEGLSAQKSEASSLAVFFDILLKVIFVVIVVLFVAGVTVAVVRLVKGAFGQKEDDRKQFKEREQDQVEKLERKKKERKVSRHFTAFRNPAQTIRRLYGRTLEEKAGKELSAKYRTATARESCRLLFAGKQENDGDEAYGSAVQEFYELYEKARYSGMEIKKEEVKRMKDCRDTLLERGRKRS